MASLKRDRELDVHKAWLGFVQPVGLVVSPPRLMEAQCVPRSDVAGIQEQLRALVRTVPVAVARARARLPSAVTATSPNRHDAALPRSRR